MDPTQLLYNFSEIEKGKAPDIVGAFPFFIGIEDIFRILRTCVPVFPHPEG